VGFSKSGKKDCFYLPGHIHKCIRNEGKGAKGAEDFWQKKFCPKKFGGFSSRNGPKNWLKILVT
jgi:hypothetical protein